MGLESVAKVCRFQVSFGRLQVVLKAQGKALIFLFSSEPRLPEDSIVSTERQPSSKSTFAKFEAVRLNFSLKSQLVKEDRCILPMRTLTERRVKAKVNVRALKCLARW